MLVLLERLLGEGIAQRVQENTAACEFIGILAGHACRPDLHTVRRPGKQGIELGAHGTAAGPLQAPPRVKPAGVEDEHLLPRGARLELVEQPAQGKQRFLDLQFALERDEEGLVVDLHDVAGEQQEDAVLRAAGIEELGNRLLDHRLQGRPGRRARRKHRLAARRFRVVRVARLLAARRRPGRRNAGGVAQEDHLAWIDVESGRQLFKHRARLAVARAVGHRIGVEVVVHADRDGPPGKRFLYLGFAFDGGLIFGFAGIADRLVAQLAPEFDKRRPEMIGRRDRYRQQEEHDDRGKPARPAPAEPHRYLHERALVDPFEVVRCACGVSGAADKSKGIVA